MKFNRRTTGDWCLSASAAGLLLGPGPLAAAQATARRGLPPVKITDLKVILTQPAGNHLVVIKILTSEPGLYGVGCATHRERPYAVAPYLEKHVKPFLIGRNCNDIEDIWQSTYVASYFRGGVTGNNALSGVDGALWDILGKRLGVPVYQLLGGKVRAAVPLYCHASARELSALEDMVRKWISQGYRYVRLQLATPGFSGYGVGGAETSEEVQKMRPAGTSPSPVFEPTPYVNTTLEMFEYLRSKLGFDVELLHDIHERVPPNQAIQLCKAVESYRPFFMEDPFAPEDVVWFPILRLQTSSAIAMGELFVNRNEWVSLIADRLIDFIRIHISAMGGLNICRKIAAFCEFFNVRTAPATFRLSGTPLTCTSTSPRTTSEFRSRTCSLTLSARSFPAPLKSKPGTCTTMISPDWVLMSTRRWPRSFLTRHLGAAVATTAGWTERSSGPSHSATGAHFDPRRAHNLGGDRIGSPLESKTRHSRPLSGREHIW